MSFLKKLFGGGRTAEPGPAAPVAEVEHNGYRIQAVPYAEAGQFQTAGVISREIDGVRKEHRFVRADRFASRDAAAEFALAKGRRIVDEQGDSLFR